jgi:hypothetical protein
MLIYFMRRELVVQLKSYVFFVVPDAFLADAVTDKGLTLQEAKAAYVESLEDGSALYALLQRVYAALDGTTSVDEMMWRHDVRAADARKLLSKFSDCLVRGSFEESHNDTW